MPGGMFASMRASRGHLRRERFARSHLMSRVFSNFIFAQPITRSEESTQRKNVSNKPKVLFDARACVLPQSLPDDNDGGNAQRVSSHRQRKGRQHNQPSLPKFVETEEPIDGRDEQE